MYAIERLRGGRGFRWQARCSRSCHHPKFERSGISPNGTSAFGVCLPPSPSSGPTPHLTADRLQRRSFGDTNVHDYIAFHNPLHLYLQHHAMVPSPRKRATRSSFNQTWADSDAASFDPSSLPVARIPRGWERKQQTKRTNQGREKKIWRRVGLRSRASNTAAEEDEEEEEEHDARSRAVKKQQHMSPKAMEKTASRSKGKNRAFKATRYDRRKSVLPSKGPCCSTALSLLII